MHEHPHETMIRRLFQAFRSGDLATVRDSMADDVTWRFPGRRGALAGTHRGWEGIQNFLVQVATLTDGTFHVELQEVLANDRQVVALFHGSGRRDTRVLDNPTALRIRIRDGKIVELQEFVWDLEHVEEFWS